MPLSKLSFKAGINRESTSYSNEGGCLTVTKLDSELDTLKKLVVG